MIEKYVSYNLISKIKQKRDKIFTKIISIEFNSLGKNCNFEYPVQLIGGKYINIGNNLMAYRNLRIEVYNFNINSIKNIPIIKIGNDVNIQPDCHIGCINSICIGNGVVIASRVSILDHYHGKIEGYNLNISPAKRKCYSKGNVIIGDNVWIGENAVILPNVVIGKGAIIGSGSIVTKDVPEYSVVAGVPARVIKTLA